MSVFGAAPRGTAGEMVESGNWPIREEKVCFGGLKIRKLGNIYILAEWSRSDGKKRRLVLGPYWHFLIITLAVVTSVSLMIYVWVIPQDEKLERIIGLSRRPGTTEACGI